MKPTTDLVEALREAITADGRTHYAIGKEADIAPDILDRFMAGRDIRLMTAAKIAAVVGLLVTPPTRSRKRGKP
jgi:hypothetical protein